MITEGVARPFLVVLAVVVTEAGGRGVLVFVFAAGGETVVDCNLLGCLVVCDPYVYLLGFQVADCFSRVACYPFYGEGFAGVLAAVGLVFDEVGG